MGLIGCKGLKIVERGPFRPGLLAASGSRGGHFLELSGLTFPLGVSVLSPAPGRHRRRGQISYAGKLLASLKPDETLFRVRAFSYFPAPGKFRSPWNTEVPFGLRPRHKPSSLEPGSGDPGHGLSLVCRTPAWTLGFKPARWDLGIPGGGIHTLIVEPWLWPDLGGPF